MQAWERAGRQRVSTWMGVLVPDPGSQTLHGDQTGKANCQGTWHHPTQPPAEGLRAKYGQHPRVHEEHSPASPHRTCWWMQL